MRSSDVFPSVGLLPPWVHGSAPGFLTVSARLFFAPANSLRLSAVPNGRDSNAGATLTSLSHPGLGGWPSVVRSARRMALPALPRRDAVREGS